MKLSLVMPGSFKNKAFAALTDEYVKRASRYATVTLHLLSVAKNSKSAESAEDDALNKFLMGRPNRYRLYILNERGKVHKSSTEFATWLKTEFDRGAHEIIFAVGGAKEYGPELQARAAGLWSLSALTLPHELATVVTAEQVYRALTINNGHPYHNE